MSVMIQSQQDLAHRCDLPLPVIDSQAAPSSCLDQQMVCLDGMLLCTEIYDINHSSARASSSRRLCVLDWAPQEQTLR